MQHPKSPKSMSFHFDWLLKHGSDLRQLFLSPPWFSVPLAICIGGHLITAPVSAQACVECLVESKAAADEKAKCGLATYTVTSPPRFYLRQEYILDKTRDDHGITAQYYVTETAVVNDALAVDPPISPRRWGRRWAASIS